MLEASSVFHAAADLRSNVKNSRIVMDLNLAI